VTLLKTEQLGVRFGGIWALRDFTVQVEQGAVHGFIGPNGSGKSTLFHLITGHYAPTTGEIYFKNTSLSNLTTDARARLGLTIKFQITSVFEGLTVLENVLLGLMGRRSPLSGFFSGTVAPADRDRALEILETVHLADRRDTLAGVLGHGEKCWLEIGMSLAAEPELLLLDEPASGMGREETKQTARLVRNLSGTRTIMVIEHDMEFVRAVADTITVLFKGELLTAGTYDDVKNDERVIDAYLGRGRKNG